MAEVPSRIPGFAMGGLVEVTWGPGAKVGPEAMEFPMVCEMSQGVLDETRNGEPVTRKAGDVWTCAVGDVDVNNGTEPATMRIFMLVPA